ncbi:MAG: hypothetical protein IJP96_10525 [Synergistaceae bacterium]|nr:hypothetical protein [Synergistaceae bacterium]
MTDQKEIFILTINDGKKSHVGDKVECSFWYTQQPENAISIEPCVDDFSGAIELVVWIDGGFVCGFSFDNLNEFYKKFFDGYIAEHENVQRTDKELNSQREKIKCIGLENGYGIVDWK